MSKAAGWRTRQHTVVNNCGKMTDVMMWKSRESDAFHVRCHTKLMGAQGETIFESILMYDEALANYQGFVTAALMEEVSAPKVGRQIIGIIDADDDDE